jgi:TM2 domain-containing membrane protein YozV
MKDKNKAARLAFFLGIFGAHKFYLKDGAGGVFYLMLFMLGIRLIKLPISLILGIIDGFILISMSDEKFDKKYNSGQQSRSRKRYRERDYPEETEAPRRSRRYEPPGKPKVERTPRARRKIVRDNPFKRSGIKKYKDFELEEAIEDFQKGIELEPEDISLHFNLACAYSLTEKPENSYYHLSKAVSYGFKDFAKIKSHDDLAYLRIQAGFHDFEQNGYQLVKNITVDEPVKKEEPANPVETQKPIEEKDPLNDDILLSQLNKLDELRTRGLISDREFQMEKRKLLRE